MRLAAKFTVLLAIHLLSTGNLEASRFRYAYRVDPASLDALALSATLTLSWLGQINEPLIGRGTALELVPALTQQTTSRGRSAS